MSKTITQPAAPELIEDLGYLFPNENSTQKRRYGLYKCSCGKEFNAQIQHVKSGNTNSCGCYRKQYTPYTKTTNWMRKHPIYSAWQNMIQRCTNNNNKYFKDYGDRGIKVCERWNDINNFIADMLPTWEKGLSIDRIDVNGNYKPSNCRWTTKTVQQRNTRKIRSTNTSGYRGVSFYKQSKKWFAQIRINGKLKYIGLFITALEAANAYDTYVIENNLEHTTNFQTKIYN